MFGLLALIVATLFAGAAVYINFAEHPARLLLDDGNLLKQWKPSYKRGYTIQASLVIIGTILGLLAWYYDQGQLLWLIGALFLFANFPFTMLVIMPLNNHLMALDAPDNNTRSDLVKWGKLHGVRSALGAISALLLFFAVAGFSF